MDVKEFDELFNRCEAELSKRYYLIPRSQVWWVTGAAVAALATLGITSLFTAKSAIDALASQAAGKAYLDRVQENTNKLDTILSGSASKPLVTVVKDQNSVVDDLLAAFEKVQGAVGVVNKNAAEDIGGSIKKAKDRRDNIQAVISKAEIFKLE